MTSTINIVKWYVKSGLFHPVVLVLLFIIVIGFYSILDTYEGVLEDTMVSVVFEYTLFPLYALSTGLHLVRSSSVIVFELNMFKDWRKLFISKILAFIFSCIPLVLMTSFIAYVMGKHYMIFPIVLRFIVYTAILGTAILLKNQKVSLLYFVTVYMLIPLSTPIILNSIVEEQGRIDMFLSLFFYYTSPITMIRYSSYTEISSLGAYIVSIFLSFIIMFISMILFKRVEYGLEQ